MTGKSGSLELTLLTSFEELEALEQAWGLLHASSTNSNLTNSFSYVYMAYKHFLSTSDKLYFVTLHDPKQKKLVGLFPFAVTNKKQYDFNFKSLSFLGLDKFKKPTPLINPSYIEECWKQVLSYTLQSRKVWQMMDLGEGKINPVEKRNFLTNLFNMTFMKRTKDVSFQSFIQLAPEHDKETGQLETSRSYFIKDRKNLKLLKEYESEQIENEYDFKVYTGEDLDYCFSQIMNLATYVQISEKSDAKKSVGGGAKNLDFTYDFYQKYFCRMAYKNNLSFGMLMHKGKVVSIEIGYIEGNNLYLDSNVVEERSVKNHIDVLSLSLFLKHYSNKGFYRCEFLCEEDSRIPFLNASTCKVENQKISKLCLKFALAFSIDLCSRTSQQMHCKIKQMLGLNSKVNA